MEKAISAADANRNFSKLLRDISEGHSYIVTSVGRPVAKIIPTCVDVQSRDRVRAALLKRLRSEPVVDVGPWRRDDLYERSRCRQLPC